MSVKFSLSLKARLALIFAAGSLCTLLVAMGYLYFGFRREITIRNHQLLASRLQEVVNVLQNHPDDLAALVDEVLAEDPSSQEAPILVRVLRDGQVKVESPGMERRLPPARFKGGHRIKAGRRHFLIVEKDVGAWKIQGALDVTADDHMSGSYRRNLLATLLLGVGVCSLFGVWAAHQGLLPLRTIAASTRGITASQLQQRLNPGNAPPELRELVHALNTMLDRLDHAFDRLSRFSADLAHELRTPITILRGEAEVALAKDRPSEDYRAVLESSLDEYNRLTRLISRMLFLARAEDPAAQARFAPIEARPLLDEVLAFFEAMAEEQEVSLKGEASGRFQGDADLLRQALANLVTNALEATPAGGVIRVSVKAGFDEVVLAVADDGRGIPREELPNLFDRFYRPSGAPSGKRSGTGLGLAIVQSIARLQDRKSVV